MDKDFHTILSFSLVVLLSACSINANANPTETKIPTATVTQTIEPTRTLFPTYTPRPTATLNIAATQLYEDMYSQVQEYYDKSYLSSKEGQYVELDEFIEEWAQIGWYQWKTLNYIADNLVVTGHLRWATSTRTPEISGCGILFAIQENSDHYGVFFDQYRVLFLYNNQSGGNIGVWEIGITRGTGRLDLGNPAEVDFTLIVNGNHSYVYVDKELIGEYTLSVDRPLKGKIGYSLLSGTNKGFGTRCEMKKMRLWRVTQ